jgi:hypothetical protein
MDRREVAVSYGYPVLDDAWTEASKKFPHANRFVLGGCVVTPESKKTSIVYVCSRCRELERGWALKHPQNPESRRILRQTKT